MNQLQQIELPKVIGVDEEKCINCHACISACPVKYCNDGSGDVVKVNSNMCIACGKCLSACTHEARFYNDDFSLFNNSLERNEDIVAIVAPSIAANFPNAYLNLNGWLKSIGVKAIFDVSFGAELTVKSYVEHIKKNNPKSVIAQPCPAIVSYLELYQPGLLKYLAPADSPMLHAIKMIKHYYPQYKDHKVLVLSPCIAKKREFHETGLGDFNVAYKSIAEYFKSSNVSLKDFPEVDYDNPQAERAVLFSSPGGLLKTAERWIPEISNSGRKIEGIPNIYEYIDKLPQVIEDGKAPLIVDCLNCEYGCNAGPVTIAKDKAVDEIEYYVEQRSEKNKSFYENGLESQEKLEAIINEYWEEGLYTREYKNLWANVNLKYPNKEQLNDIFISMHKYSEKDIYNCTSCGYNSCEKMATAIFNGLNKAENCHHYLETEKDYSHNELQKSEKRVNTILETAHDGFIQIDKNTIIEQANLAFREMVKRNDAVGTSLFDFLDDENKNHLLEQLKLRNKNIQSSYELTLNQSDGGKINCLVSGTPLFNDNDQNIGSFAMFSDITVLKKVENELRKSKDELEIKVLERTSELNDMLEELKVSNEVINSYNKELEKLSIVASEIDNATIIMDPKGNFEWVNDGYTKMFGSALYEVKGKNIISENTSEYVKNLINDGIKQKVLINYEFEHVRDDGSFIWIQETITPILDKKGDLKKLIAVDSDITALKENEFEITSQKEEILSQRDKIEKQRDIANKQAQDIRSSITYASKIQKALLPEKNLMKKYFPDHFIINKPKDIVSGDFYWVCERDGKHYIAAADCTGHGVPGAFLSMLGITFLNEIVNSSTYKNEELQANKILNILRQKIKRSLKQTGKDQEAKDGMDITLCILDYEKKEMQFAGANNPIFIVKNGEINEIKGDRMPVGIYHKEKESFTNHKINIEKGDSIYLFSDGILDQFNGVSMEKFMKKRFREILASVNGMSMKDQGFRFDSAINVWQGGGVQVDDMLLIGIRV